MEQLHDAVFLQSIFPRRRYEIIKCSKLREFIKNGILMILTGSYIYEGGVSRIVRQHYLIMVVHDVFTVGNRISVHGKERDKR